VPDEAARVPAGLTTDGLLGHGYMARFIDSMFLSLLILAVLRLAGAPSDQFSLLSVALVLIVWIGYGPALESSPWQATLGKRFMRLRVYDSGAGRLTPLRAAGRSLVKDGPFIVLAFVPGGRRLSHLARRSSGGAVPQPRLSGHSRPRRRNLGSCSGGDDPAPPQRTPKSFKGGAILVYVSSHPLDCPTAKSSRLGLPVHLGWRAS
jgi:uncharacterized RDD family membrane protein YckC